MATTTVTAPDGRILCVESGGDAAGKPVLIHAGTPNSRLLPPPALRDAEERGIHLLSYDRPGYGGSTDHPGRTVADCASDVAEIARAFGFDRLAMWGTSGGGPHVLACAALLPDLVCAAASLASIAPYGAPGLDYFTGMGELNVQGVKEYFSDRDAARLRNAADRDQLLRLTPEQLSGTLASVLSSTDDGVLSLQYATFLVDSFHDGLAPGDEGLWEDGCAVLEPWGFDLEAIRVPVQLWHGKQDQFVPFQHGQWLADHIPGVDAHLTEEDGHLTLIARLPEIHAWLLERS